MAAMNVLAVITRAMRLLGGVASGNAATNDEGNDGLLAFNSMKRALFGTIIGPRLSVQQATAQAENGGLYQVPSPFAITAPANPRAGARFGVTADCTVSPNGRLINNASGSYQTGGPAIFWYRGDTGTWLVEADSATLTAAIEFPDALIEYLPYMLAPVISAEYGSDLPPEVLAGAAEGRAAFARQYGRRGRAAINPPIGIAQPQAQG